MSTALTIVAAALALAAGVPQAVASPWDGVYRLDVKNSRLTADAFSYAPLSGGGWRMMTDRGAFDFALDGRPYALGDVAHTQTVTKIDDHTLWIVMSANGKPTSTIRETLAPDDASLTDVVTTAAPDGSRATYTAVSRREGAGRWFFGKWVSVDLSSSPSTIVPLTIATASNGVVTWRYGSDGSQVSGRPDGTPLPVTGPDIPAGDTIAFRTISNRRMDFITAHGGKTRTVGYYELSIDGRELDDVFWAPDEPKQRQTKVYIRQ